MSAYPERLAVHVDSSLCEDSDLRVISLLMGLAGIDVASVDDDLWLLFARSIRAHRDGHACIDLRDEPSLVALLEMVPGLVAASPERDVSPRRPFVLDDARLYVSRAHSEETSIAVRLVGLATQGRLKILLGGPGTGKTTMIASDLVQLFDDHDTERVDVALAAPTGKAADRMRRALIVALDRVKPRHEVRERISSLRATTVHRLLGYSPSRDTGRYRYGSRNHLPHDVVVVDEASMLSMSLMHRLLDAMRPDSTLMLVGDPDQLVSVDAGSVLGDIARVEAGAVAEARTTLTVTHRFDPSSSIGRLITAIREPSPSRDNVVMAILNDHLEPDEVLTFVQTGSEREGLEWIAAMVKAWAALVVDRSASGDIVGALAAQSTMQVLCATRRGALGATSWNRTVASWLGVRANRVWYPGRPVMITRNDPANDLYNGDVGVVVDTGAHGLMAAFNGADGPRLIAPVRLGDVETVHALTIHKSQGSEYDHAVVVLPEESRILTRELLYTGASRAKTRLTIVASEAAVRHAVTHDVERATGLAMRL